jgi:hypothetical protein
MLLERKGKRDLGVIERIASVEKPINQLAENSASFLSGISSISWP